MSSHHSRPYGARGQRRTPPLFSACAVVLLLFFVCGTAQPALARLERQTYVSYRTPHLCSYSIKEAVNCGGEKPMCCVVSSAIRCCAGTTSCGNCTDVIVGYEMPKSSVILGCFSLSVLVLLGSIIMSGVGRHLAWVLERRRVIENYRKRLLLRRAEAREFKKELAETEEKDVEDSVACVICCARHIDVALTPCGHVCCCKFCAKRLKECPVCRAAVQRCFDLPLYYVKQLVKASAEGETDGEEGGEHAHGTPAAVAAAPNTTGADASTAQREDQETAVEEDSDGAAGRRTSYTEEGEDEAAATSPISSSAHFNPFRSKRYMRLFNDDADVEEEEEEEMRHAGTRGAVISPAPVDAATTASSTGAGVTVLGAGESASVSQSAAPRRGGFISVEK